VPGELVLNLHAENTELCAVCTKPVHELVVKDFEPMTFSDLIDWFLARKCLIATDWADEGA
jgi:hypothetical protein